MESLDITEQAFAPATLFPIRASVALTLKVLTYDDLPVAVHPGYALFLVHQVLKEAMATVAGVAGALSRPSRTWRAPDVVGRSRYDGVEQASVTVPGTGHGGLAEVAYLLPGYRAIPPQCERSPGTGWCRTTGWTS